MHRNFYSKILFMMITLLMMQAFVKAGDPGYAPFERSLKGLEGLYFVNQSIIDQIHRGTISKITPTQAAKTLKPASQSLGLEYSDRLQDFLDFYTSPANRKGVEIMLGLAAGYLPLFESYLVEEKLPAELMYLPMALSSLNTREISQWGATGLWQIMYTNGRLYQLQIDSYVDERRDPSKATRAAVQHLKDLYGIYSDWELAIAAYTNSPSNINKAIRKAGGSRQYSDLYNYLPVETRDYLPAIAACYILMHQYEKTGLKPYEIQNPGFNLRVQVERRLHLGQVSEVLNIPIEFLQDMNPEFKSSVVPAGNNKTYWIKLPSDKNTLFSEYADSIYNFRDTFYFPTRRNIVVSEVSTPAATTHVPSDGESKPVVVQPSPPSTSAVHNRTKLTYTVKDGDNLGYISEWYNVGVSDIRGWNNMRGDIIRVGQVLDIWVPNSRVNQFKDIDNLTFAEKQRGATNPAQTTPARTTTSASQPTRTSKASAGGFTWYTVKRGETLTGIAAKYPEITADEIMELNKIRDPRSLQAGQKLKIPKK